MVEPDIEKLCGVTRTGRVRHLRWMRADGTWTQAAHCDAYPLRPLLAGDPEWRLPLCKKCDRAAQAAPAEARPESAKS